jgi:thiamine biosynthesis lipoprotein
MFGIKKHRGLIWSVIISLLLGSCETNENENRELAFTEISGEAQGTTYSIILCDSNVKITKKEVDSILFQFDMALSTYRKESIISQLNASEKNFSFSDEFNYFKDCYELSQDVYRLSEGAFDPSIMPLVDAWGFYKERKHVPTQMEIDSLLRFVSFEPSKLHSLKNKGANQFDFEKIIPEFRLDFNAVAQGLSVDVVADYIREKGGKNFYVEIGGEIVVSGKNREGENWRIGIDSPQVNDSIRLLDKVISVSNKALATSGNYRKFYEVDGKKYAHTIDPISGMPVDHNLLSATVICESAGKADAWATAFMVLGVEKTKEFLKKEEMRSFEVYLIFDDGTGKYDHWMSSGFEKFLK